MRITENLLKRTKKKEIYRTDVTCGHAKYAYSEGRGITYDFNDGRLYSYSKRKGNFLTNMFRKRVKSSTTAWDLSANEIVPNYEEAFSLAERVLAVGTGCFLETT